MTTAHQITAALKGRWHGSYGMVSCPSHADGKTPALKISDDPRKSDGIDLHCFGGCPWETVKRDLARGGLLKAWEPKNGTPWPKLPGLQAACPSRAKVILLRLSCRRQLHHVLRRRFDEIADVPSPLL